MQSPHLEITFELLTISRFTREGGPAVTGFHPVANLFPMLSEKQFRELLTDIQAHGQLSPIWLHDGLIVDGRNRYRACLELGIGPVFQEWDQHGDLLDFVIGFNLKRRHLTATQKAVVAFRMLFMLEAKAKERQLRRSADSVPEILPEQKGDSRDQAAALVGISGRYVSDVKRIAQEAPERLKDLEAGKITLQGALWQISGKGAKGRSGAAQQETVTSRTAVAVIRQLSKVKEDDPQVLKVMKRVQIYVDNRIPQIATRTKGNNPRNQVPENQLSLFEVGVVAVPLKG